MRLEDKVTQVLILAAGLLLTLLLFTQGLIALGDGKGGFYSSRAYEGRQLR